MLGNYIQQAMVLFEKADAILICDKKGYIEYAKWYKDWFFLSAEVVGKHILEVYPTLTEETSTILQCIHRKESVMDEEQHIVNFKGELIHVMSTTQPIVVEEEIIGAICASSFCKEVRKRSGESQSGGKKRLYVLEDIITQNFAMKEMKNRITNAARSSCTVLIYGETGTGKELVAESIHTGSSRKEQAFISQNCAAIPSALLEGLFFGTEKGSYTGAEKKKGLFELADRGTLFLDEINSMDISIQAKILKAIEEKKVRHLGGTKDIEIDVRIVCAMNEEPFEALKKGRLREDLFYRIGVVQLRVLPLRERREDITLLADHFINYFNRELGRNVKGLSDLAANAFETQYWRGNVRELRNTIESAFINLTGDTITIKCLPDLFFTSKELENRVSFGEMPKQKTFSLTTLIEEYEKALIEQALRGSSNMAEAAWRMKVSRQKLKYKMEKYGIAAKEGREGRI